MSRDLDDAVGEMLRRSSCGNTPPLWPEWCRDEWRSRARHFLRLLPGEGLDLRRAGEPTAPPPASTSPVIWRGAILAGKAERMVRAGAGHLSIIRVEAGAETVEQSFSLVTAHVNAGLVLSDDPAARKIPGLGRQLAATMELYRLDAVELVGVAP